MLTAETVDRIIRFDGQGLPVTSLYAAVQAGPGGHEDLQARVSSLLDQVRPLAKNGSAGREERLSVRADIARIKDALAVARPRPGGLAVFACSGRGLYSEIALPSGVRDRVMVDTTPWVRPMLAILDELRRACVVVLDKASACLWEAHGDELRELSQIQDTVLRKPNFAAGLAEYRVRNKAGELSRRHYRNVAAALDELFRAGEADLLVIGGHDYEVPVFTEYLPAAVRARIAGTFSVGPGTATPALIAEQAAGIVGAHERAKAAALAAGVLDSLDAGGLAAAGLADCLWAGSVAATQTLLVRDGAARPGVVCDKSRWLALEGGTCPLCGQPTRSTPDVIDELAEAVIAEGGQVRHVGDASQLRGHEVAARLRFRLPPAPAA